MFQLLMRRIVQSESELSGRVDAADAGVLLTEVIVRIGVVQPFKQDAEAELSRQGRRARSSSRMRDDSGSL